MIGVFDSGVGGFNSLHHLRRLLPMADIVYLADRENAPYGTKGEDDLVFLAERCIDRLRQRGADKILIACCTASTVWDKLGEAQRRISIPIIPPVADALEGVSDRVLVIATERTVASGAFGSVIRERYPSSMVVEAPMQSLVSAVERGARNGNMAEATRDEILSVRALAEKHRPGALVLGCTHFSSVANLISKACPGVRIISPAELGARALAGEVIASGKNIREQGRLIYM